MTNVVLESLLRPLEEFYKPSFVEEIAINHAGQVWMRLHGAPVPWVPYDAPALTKQYLIDLIHTIANIYERPFDPIHGMPVVYATLPGNHRFTAIAGPNVQYDERDVTGGVALNIRGGGVAETSFENYHLKRGEKLLKVKPRENVRPDDPYERLMSAKKCDSETAAKNGDTVVIDFAGYLNGEQFAGGTANGYSLVLGSGQFVPGFEEQLICAEKGETRDVDITFPTDYVPELAGKDVVFKVTVVDIIKAPVAEPAPAAEAPEAAPAAPATAE